MPLGLARRGGRVVLVGLAGDDLLIGLFPLEGYEEAYQVLPSSSGPRGKVILDVHPETAAGTR